MARTLHPWLTVVVVAVTCSACAGATHLTKEKPVKPAGSTILIDAKQRAITNAMVDGKLRVCAEPSPDALSALAASAGLSVSKPDVLQLATNASLAEGAGSIGLRTQSIQLMRDAMYRLCEGYVSGAIDGPAFETLQRRFQSSMVAILAIEQLTGALRAPALALGGAASEGAPERVADLTDKTEQSREVLTKAEADRADKQDKAAQATTARKALEKEESDLKKKEMPTDAEKKRLAELAGLIKTAKESEATAEAALENATETKANREASFKAFDEARQAALAGGGQASVKAILGTADDHRDPTAAVAAVQAIVDNTLNLEFGRELCTTLLTKAIPAAAPFANCVAYLGESVEALRGQRLAMASLTPDVLDLLRAITGLLNNPQADSAKVKAAADALAVVQKILTSKLQAGPLLLATH